MSGTVEIGDAAPGVRLVTIARQQRRNALDRATYAALTAAIARAGKDEGVRVVVLTGAGGCFTSGNDVNDFQDVSDDGQPSAGIVFLRALAACRKPVVAAVEGFAIGIGATLLLHCDLAYAGEGAAFRFPFTQLGLCPEGASTLLLPRLSGTKRAAELLMLGEAFSPQEAREAGLVNAITPQGGALEAALRSARKLAALPPGAVEATKALLRAGLDADVAAAFERESRVFHALRRGPEAQAAFAAFLRK